MVSVSVETLREELRAQLLELELRLYERWSRELALKATIEQVSKLELRVDELAKSAELHRTLVSEMAAIQAQVATISQIDQAQSVRDTAAQAVREDRATRHARLWKLLGFVVTALGGETFYIVASKLHLT